MPIDAPAEVIDARDVEQDGASRKSMRRTHGSDDDRQPEDWRAASCSNDTHESTSDLDSQLYRMSNAAPTPPSYSGDVLTDNRHALMVNAQASIVDRTAERAVAAQRLANVAVSGKQLTVGANRAYDISGLVKASRNINVTPHLAQNLDSIGGRTIDGHTTQHPGYAISRRRRKCVEQCFGWGKLIGPICQMRAQELDKVGQLLTLMLAANDLTRRRTLEQLRAQGTQ